MGSEIPSEIPSESSDGLNPLNTNPVETTISTKDSAIKNQLIKEISRLDKWASVGADNGLFLIGNNPSIYEKIVNGLKDARMFLERNDIPETQRQLSFTIQNYSEALHATSKKWRFINMNGGLVLIYLLSFLVAISTFYAIWGINGFQSIKEITPPPFDGVGVTAIHAVTWGVIGGTLRGLWFLKDKVGDRSLRNSWNIYFISVPFIGGLFGAIIYLIIIAGLLAFNPDQDVIPNIVPQINTTMIGLEQSANQISDYLKNTNATPTIIPPTQNPTTTDVIKIPGPSYQTVSLIKVQSPGSSGISAIPQQTPVQNKAIKGLNNSTSQNSDINKTLENLEKDIAVIKSQLKVTKSDAIIGQPLTIIPFAALAGFNWEWLLMTFKRVGDKRSGDDNKEFARMLEEDITKLDR